jgi:uncharacterized membrane protein YeiH
VGTGAFALSGFLVGIRRKLDLFGVLLLSIITALGGGIARDAIVGNLPASMTSYHAVTVVFGAIVMALAFGLHKKEDLEQKLIFIVSDSAGLVAFAIGGALVAMERGLNLFGVVILSLLTAVGGGMLRDMLINETPLILVSEFYATVAILVAFSVYAASSFGVLGVGGMVTIFALFFCLRLVAYFKGWRLPKFN